MVCFKHISSFNLYFPLADSMIMFSTFEHSVDFIYRNVIKRRKQDCSRTQQLGVTCLAGYTAGAVGTVISNPADNIVSSLYNKKADTVLQVTSASEPNSSLVLTEVLFISLNTNCVRFGLIFSRL